MSNPPITPEVDNVFRSYSDDAQAAMAALRALIYKVAASNPAVGTLTETLKWGVPSYLTGASKSGSTIRIAWDRAEPAQASLYFNCKTTLVDRMREIYPGTFAYQSNRMISYPLNAPPVEALMHCIEMALLYHRNKRQDK